MSIAELKAVHKRRPHGGRGCPARKICEQGRGIQMWTSAVFGAKNFGFFESYGVPARTRGVNLNQVQIFFGQGERSIFRDFVRTSLRMAPYSTYESKNPVIFKRAFNSWKYS